MASEVITISSLIQKQITLISQCQINLETQAEDPASQIMAAQGGMGATPEKLQILCNALKILQECGTVS